MTNTFSFGWIVARYYDSGRNCTWGHAALAVPEISGIILNPWNRTIQLDKTLIRIIKGA